MARIEMVNLEGRAKLLMDGRLIDVAERSGGRLPTEPMTLLTQWRAFETWAADQAPAPGDPDALPGSLAACVPTPGQVFGIGLNYRDHAEEAKLDIPSQPMVFTKFASCISAPWAPIPIDGNRIDWEVELVVVLAGGGRDIAESEALSHVAGYCVGQDISDRRRQFGDKPAQFSLGKSRAGYGPVGPGVVSLSALEDPDDLRLSCDVDGERMQDGRTTDMIFSVRQLVSYLSRYVELRPGDLIFTGTPAGVGSVRTPRRYLAEGETVRSEIEGLGVLENRCVAANPARG
jgi:2-keto-4-pentenoate hydratase/2-oxohepta-3-ene-1,7-dioic acid hydratase in catechol pathway